MISIVIALISSVACIVLFFVNFFLREDKRDLERELTHYKELVKIERQVGMVRAAKSLLSTLRPFIIK